MVTLDGVGKNSIYLQNMKNILVQHYMGGKSYAGHIKAIFLAKHIIFANLYIYETNYK